MQTIIYDYKPSVNLKYSWLDFHYLQRQSVGCSLDTTNKNKIVLTVDKRLSIQEVSNLPSHKQEI